MKQSRFFVFAVLLLALWSCGRKKVDVPPDTNLSPETVLIATPYDTSFVKTPGGGIPTAVIYRYHAHWYGSDPDGKVVGYVVVVTDTNGVPGIADYLNPFAFTTRTDTIFEFKVTPNSQRYPHTIWVSAIDDKGKADFSPASVILNAEDRYLPEPKIKEFYAVTPDGRRVDLRDNSRNPNIAPTDTIPVGSRIHASWTGTTQDPFGRIIGYRYRIGSVFVATRDSSVDLGPSDLGLGRNEFHLRAQDAAHGETGAGGAPDTVRVFAYNFGPGTWLTDPQSASLPAEARPLQRRFYEVRDGRVFAHVEGDTISRYSDVRLAFGGWDRDGQVRGFSVKLNTVWVFGGSSSPPPTPTTPPPGSLEVFEPYLHQVFQFFSKDESYRAAARTFTVRAFDYDGQVDPNGTSIRVISGFRPFFRIPEFQLIHGTTNRNPMVGDTVVIDSSAVKLGAKTMTVRAPGYDANIVGGRLITNVPNSYTFVLDPESTNPVTYESQSISTTIDLVNNEGKNLPYGLHVVEVTLNDYDLANGQNIADGRTARVRIPFFFGRRNP